MKFKTVKRFIKSTPWGTLFLVIVLILTSSWMPDILKGESLFSTWLNLPQWLIGVINGIIFFTCLIWLYHIRHKFFPFRTLSCHPCEPHKGVIMLLSTPTPNISFSTDSFPITIQNNKGEIAILEGNSLKNDISALNSLKNPWWNWQQLLRALLPHKDTLKIAYLIGSKDEDKRKGSYQNLDDAEKLIKGYFPNIQIIKAEKPIDFENLDEVEDLVARGITRLNEEGIKEKDIIIDVTGGQKTTSIAGAVVTMNRCVTFQYVQTNKPYGVLAYDVIVLPGLPGEE